VLGTLRLRDEITIDELRLPELVLPVDGEQTETIILIRCCLIHVLLFIYGIFDEF
jgi:hypothetical protein